MAEETSITLIGNVVDEVDLRFTPSGAAVAKFRLASTPSYFDKATSTFKDGETLFLSVNVWRQMAENLSESGIGKGTRVVVVGRLKQRNYETKEGEKRTVFEVEADEVAVSLKFATAKVQKMARSGGGDSGSRGGQTTSRGGDGDPWASSAPAGGGYADDSPPF